MAPCAQLPHRRLRTRAARKTLNFWEIPLMSTLEELRKLIQEKFGVDPALLEADTSLQASGLDSLALVEYLFVVEDHFGVSLVDLQDGVDTLAKLADIVDRLKAEKAATAQTA